MTFPALSPRAKAYASALVTLLATVLSAVLPLLDGGVASTVTVILTTLASYGVVYAVPNSNYPQRAKPRGGLLDPLLSDPAPPTA